LFADLELVKGIEDLTMLVKSMLPEEVACLIF
jgi:hypothetical protein